MAIAPTNTQRRNRVKRDRRTHYDLGTPIMQYQKRRRLRSKVRKLFDMMAGIRPRGPWLWPRTNHDMHPVSPNYKPKR